ncbi:hypothetical protein FD754_011843, partial [Muntiacus muntjak]
ERQVYVSNSAVMKNSTNIIRYIILLLLFIFTILLLFPVVVIDKNDLLIATLKKQRPVSTKEGFKMLCSTSRLLCFIPRVLGPIVLVKPKFSFLSVSMVIHRRLLGKLGFKLIVFPVETPCWFLNPFKPTRHLYGPDPRIIIEPLTMCKNIANGIVKKTSSSLGNPNVFRWNNRRDPTLEFLRKFGIGLLSGTIASVINIPFDVAKSRIQGPQPVPGEIKYRTCFKTMATVYQEEGILALYKGLLPKIMRLGPAAAWLSPSWLLSA